MNLRRKKLVSTAIAIMMGAWSSLALAGIADSPLPVLGGVGTVHVFSVTGVQSTTGGLGAPPLETEFFCTSLEPANPIQIGVQVFSYSGGAPLNDVSTGNGAVTVAPGQTVTVSTGPIASFLPDSTMSGLPALSGASARIVSTSKRIMCSAIVTDGGSVPPASMASLQVIKGRTQRGN